MPTICDYEGSRYRTEFWEGQNRAYEDAVERAAMRKMLPPQGERLIEIGAGFGRLADLYQGYEQVVLVDYARTQLEEARRYLNDDPRFVFVVADIYNLPFVGSRFDALTMVRVMHHLVDVPAALAELQRIIAPAGTAIVEHASKLNLKAILRWLGGGQSWSPFAPAPVEFVEMNFNFHPAWMRRQFEAAGLTIQNCRTLSHFRLDSLKKLLPTDLLVWLDQGAQLTGNWWQLTPSIFLQAQAQKPNQLPACGLFRCPHCHASLLAASASPGPEQYTLTCYGCSYGWSYRDRIYDFRTPVATPGITSNSHFGPRP